MPTVYRRRRRDGTLAPTFTADIWIDGAKFPRSTGETSRREAEKKAVELERQLRSDLARSHEALTVDTLMGRYWQDHAGALASATDTKYFIRQILKVIDRDTPLEKLSNSDIAQFVLTRSRMGVSDSTINRELDVLRAAYTMARDRWEHPVRPIRWKDHRRQIDTERTVTLTLDEARLGIELLAPLWPDTADCMELAIYTGARLNELETLTIGRVNLSAREATVLAKRKARQDYRERRIYLNANACALIEPRLKGDPDALVFNLTNRRKAWEWVRKQIGRPEVRWHDLRHTHGTWVRQGGAALEVVKKSLGHTHIRTTLRYAHVAADEVHDAVETLPSLRDRKVVALRRGGGK